VAPKRNVLLKQIRGCSQESATRHQRHKRKCTGPPVSLFPSVCLCLFLLFLAPTLSASGTQSESNCKSVAFNWHCSPLLDCLNLCYCISRIQLDALSMIDSLWHAQRARQTSRHRARCKSTSKSKTEGKNNSKTEAECKPV